MAICGLGSTRYAEANLALIGEEWKKKQGITDDMPNPLNKPMGTQRALDLYHREHGLLGSYGSYGERRGDLWRGTYLDAMEDPIHMAIDINVRARARVMADRRSKVVWKDNDFPDSHGWGNRVIVRFPDIDIWMIYAHLADDVRCSIGDTLERGDVFAQVGTPIENGGWYEHLHVQAMTAMAWGLFCQNPRAVDGYCPARSWPMLKEMFPDPSQYIGIP